MEKANTKKRREIAEHKNPKEFTVPAVNFKGE